MTVYIETMFQSFLTLITIFLLLLSSKVVYAQTPIPLPASDVENRFSASGLPAQIVSAVLSVVLPIAGFITVIVIIISGIQFVTSSGNPEAAAAARGRLTYALIGFVIIILAFSILQIVDNLFLGNSGIV